MSLLRLLLVGVAVLIIYRLLKRFIVVSFHHTGAHGTRSYRYPGEKPEAKGPGPLNRDDIVDAHYKDIH